MSLDLPLSLTGNMERFERGRNHNNLSTRKKEKKTFSRKESRKEGRRSKKRRRLEHQMTSKRNQREEEKEVHKHQRRRRSSESSTSSSLLLVRSKKKKDNVSVKAVGDPFAGEEEYPEDQEIDYLERKLGLKGKKVGGKKGRKDNWKRLTKEWKKDGFGDDFGEFIAGLDTMSERIGLTRHEKSMTSSDDDNEDVNDQQVTATAPFIMEKEYPEDQEIDYLERKLGLKGKKAGGKKGKKENWKRLTKEWKKDGFGDDFGEFIAGLDTMSERIELQKSRASGGEESDVDEDDVDTDNASAAIPSSSSSGDESEEGEEEDEETNESVEKATYIPSQNEIDIYGRRNDGEDEEESVVKKYVPPHQRVLNESRGKSANRIRQLQRQIQGQLNRLSESNIAPIMSVIKGCFDAYPRMQVCAVLASKLLRSCADQIRDNIPLMRCYAALISSLHVCVGPEIGAYFLEDVARQFDKSRAEAKSSEENTRTKFECMNLLLVLLFMYQNSALHHSFIVEIANQLVADLSSPAHLELLLSLLMHCGFAIRKEEPGSLVTIVKSVHKQADMHRERWEQIGCDSRAQFMLDTISDLSSNRQRAAQHELQQGGHRLRVWVQRLKSGNQRAHPPLRVSWEDLMASGHRGRWWIVGSSWTGRENHSAKDQDVKASRDPSGVEAPSAAMLALASKHHMNTDSRKSIFCVLMSSSDYLEAFERLLKLGLKGPQRREIMRVLVYCCGVSKRYNPYFALVAKQQCQYDHRAKFTMQLCFWDVFKQFADSIENKKSSKARSAERKLMNYACLLAEMTGDFHLSLAAIKTIDVLSLTPDATFFLKAFFHKLIDSNEDTVLEAVFRRIGATKDCTILLDSISVFFKTHMSAFTDKAWLRKLRVAKMALRDVAIVANARRRV